MKYLPYFLIVLVLIVLVFAVLKLTTGRDRGKRNAVETKISKAILEEMGMKVEKMEDLEEQGVNLRLLVIKAESEDHHRQNLVNDSIKTLKWSYERFTKPEFEKALDHRGLQLADISELSNEELKEIYESHQRKKRRYLAKFSWMSTTREQAEASIFTYAGEGKVELSIPHEQLTMEQREHLTFVEKHLEFNKINTARNPKERGDTKFVVFSDEEAVQIVHYWMVPYGVRGRGYLGAWVYDRKTGKAL